MQAEVAAETTKALRNALVLVASLVTTLGIASVIRFWLPRHIGVDAFGQVSFADAWTQAGFVFLHLGVDTYISREVATRVDHASDFIGGVILVRAAMTVAVLIGLAVGLFALNKNALAWQLVFIFAVGQLFFIFNSTWQAILNARGEVRELAIISASSKAIWGVLVVAGVLLSGSLLMVAIAYTVTEIGKTFALVRVARKYVKLTFLWTFGSAKAVVIAALPFYVNFMAHDVYARVDAIMLSAMTTDAEVGIYSAAVNINILALLVLPIMNAVLMPMTSRVAKHTPDALDDVMRATLRLVLVLAVPITLMLALHSDALVHVLFGDRYAASARALRVLAPVIPLSYVCIVSSSHLVQLGKVWIITRVAILGIVVHPLISLVTIPYGVAHGSGALGAGVSTLISEVIVTVGFLVALGRSGPDRALVGNLLRLVATCAIGAAVHFLLPPLAALDSPVSLWRLVVEVPVFIGVGTLLGAIPMREMVTHVRRAVRK